MSDATGAVAEVVTLASELIAIDTTNVDDPTARGTERTAAEYVAGKLADVGYEPVYLESGAPGRGNVVVRLTGADPSRGGLLVHGHLDVVPADASEWSVHPFSGEVSDGYLWGRGAVDMKGMVAMTLAVARAFKRDGVVPPRDLVFAFVADEEAGGFYGARWLVDNHPELFDGCAAAISESGAFTHHVDGIRVYPVGTAERGTAHLRLTAKGRAGHASRRNPNNPVATLVQALSRIAEYRWPVHLTPPVLAFLEQVSAALGTDLDLEDVDGSIGKLGAAAALVENTVRASSTPTVLRAGSKVNVIPSQAVAEVDVRTLPGIEDEVLNTLDDLLGPGVTREFIGHQRPVQAPMDTPWFDALADALRAGDPEAVVVPYCMGGGTDAKAFSTLGIACYGFAPLWIPADFDYRAVAHGVDERVPIAGLGFGVRVLDHFLSR